MSLKNLAPFSFIAVTISILFINSAFPATYYVKNGGNDGASGLSDADAWATIAKVNDFAAARGFSSGDSIKFRRGDTWTNDETLGYAGGCVQWGTISELTIEDYGTGDKPWFDGNTHQPIKINSKGITTLVIRNIAAGGMDRDGSGDCNISIGDDIANVILDGLVVNGQRGSSVVNRHSGIGIGDIQGNVEIKNCEISYCVKLEGPGTVAYDQAGLIMYWNWASTKTSGTVSIHHNTIHHVEGDCVQLAGLVTPTISIYKNTFHHFGENAIDLKACQNVRIHNNDIYRGTYPKGGTNSSNPRPETNIIWHGFPDRWLSTYPDSIEVYDNYIHTTDGTGVYSGGGNNHRIYRNHFKDCLNSIRIVIGNNNEFYDNLIEQTTGYKYDSDYDGYYSGIMIESVGLTIKNLKIHNNTIYSSSTTNRYGIWYEGDNLISGVEIKRNILYLDRNFSGTYPQYAVDRDGKFPIVEYNNSYNASHVNRVYWDQIVYTASQQTAWINAGHTGAIFEDPLFADAKAGDFTLRQDSPCRLPDGILGAPLPLSVGPAAGISPPNNLRLTARY